jgi:hypothetical protein
MISEGRVVHILLLLREAEQQLELSFDADDEVYANTLVIGAQELLKRALYHGRKLDQPVSTEELRDLQS